MSEHDMVERIDTVVIGAGQAGLSTGYWLKRLGVPFLILDGAERIGDAWRARWDSLRLFTPARFDGLVGMPFPAPAEHFPTKDEMADYLEAYAARFDLPVRLGRRVDRVTREDGGLFVVRSGDRRVVVRNVIVAMASYQAPHVPAFAGELAPDIVQIHSADYRNPAQLPPGAVLLVGAGNSGSEIAMELSRDRTVWMAGRDVGQIPFDIHGFLGRKLMTRLVLRGLFHRLLTVSTPIGRRARSKILSRGGPLIRVKRAHLDARGVQRVARVDGVRDGLPLLTDGRLLDVAAVVWCTGFRTGFASWLDLPVHGTHEPRHERGVVEAVPGLFFVGLHFQYAMSSTMIHGVGRDAERIARAVAARRRSAAASARDHAIQAAPGRVGAVA